MLQEREQQLEISMGSYQSFMEHAQDLLSWLQGKLDMGALFGLPPADLDVVEGFQRDVEVRGGGGPNIHMWSECGGEGG